MISSEAPAAPSARTARESVAPRPAVPRALHRWLGIVTVVMFLATGWVLRLHQPPMPSLDWGMRMLLRSGHIYILFTGLLNLALGLYPAPALRGARRWLAFAGSLLAILSVVGTTLGFFLESARGGMDRPITSLGIYAAFGGTLLHLLAARGVELTNPFHRGRPAG